MTLIYLIITLRAAARGTTAAAAVRIFPLVLLLGEVELLPLGSERHHLALLRLERLPPRVAPQPRLQIKHAADYLWNRESTTFSSARLVKWLICVVVTKLVRWKLKVI